MVRGMEESRSKQRPRTGAKDKKSTQRAQRSEHREHEENKTVEIVVRWCEEMEIGGRMET